MFNQTDSSLFRSRCLNVIHKALKENKYGTKTTKIRLEKSTTICGWCMLSTRNTRNHKTFKLNIGKMCAYVDPSPASEKPKIEEN